MPRLIILAGPNGAGKTTFAREFLQHEAACKQFVNADLIAAGLSPFAVETAQIAAGRIMIERVREFIDAGLDFALETTLSGKWVFDVISRAQSEGYEVGLYYLRLRDPEQSIERVQKRVSKGGHDVPEAFLRRRFQRSLDILERCKELVNYWIVYDNSGWVAVEVERGFQNE